MSRQEILHPKAYLKSKRNVKAGLVSRSKILRALDDRAKSAKEISRDTSLSYTCVAYHLTSLKRDQLVQHLTKTKPFTWGLTPYGQQKLPT
ncbi:MAG TPA: winged helix-turn-helix domain-containing protein [Methylomirabilota bacterium]|nr:winged helix-turn-helix domain-containing protein [Methylomirabilota bacterium]